MDPTATCCPNLACPTRGQVGQGNIRLHSRKDKRFLEGLGQVGLGMRQEPWARRGRRPGALGGAGGGVPEQTPCGMPIPSSLHLLPLDGREGHRPLDIICTLYYFSSILGRINTFSCLYEPV